MCSVNIAVVIPWAPGEKNQRKQYTRKASKAYIRQEYVGRALDSTKDTDKDIRLRIQIRIRIRIRITTKERSPR